MKPRTWIRDVVCVLLTCLLLSGCDWKKAASSPSPTLTESVNELNVGSPALTDPVNVPFETASAAQTEAAAILKELPTNDPGYIVILTDGLPGPEDDRKNPWEERAVAVREAYNVELVFNVLDGREADIPGEIARSVVSGASVPDLALVSRGDMATLAAGGYIEDITDAVLGYGMPEAYYSAGWLDGRIFGFSVKPSTGDGLLIYNTALLESADGLAMPGDLFDAGDWSRQIFYDYCRELIQYLPDEVTVIDIDQIDFFLGIVYANGGYVNNPETGVAMYATDTVRKSLSYMQSLAQAGILTRTVKGMIAGDAFAEGTAVFTCGNAADIERYLDLGLTIGVVPYPWGANVKVNSQAASLDDMLLYGYKTAASFADLFVITKNKNPDTEGVEKSGALTKISAAAYIDIVFTYLLDEGDEMRANAEQERQGLWAVSQSSIPTGLTGADLRRYEWYISRPAAIIPANAGSELFFLELAECVFGGWDVNQWTQSVTSPATNGNPLPPIT